MRPTMKRSLQRLPMLALAAALLVSPLAAAPAHAADPGVAQVDTFDNALLDVMKNGKTLGPKGRYRRLEPVVQHEFDLAAMTRFAVGPAWSTFTPSQQSQAVEAFTRLTIASYAHNFDDYSGQSFQVDPNPINRGPDKLVQSKMLRQHDAPVQLSYRMRESGGTWKIIDIYFNNISQLTTRRSDFAKPLADGGASGLIAHLNTLVDSLMK